MKMLGTAALVLQLVAVCADAQTLADRVLGSGDGDVELLFASRPGACGDGRHFIHDAFGGERWTDEGMNVWSGRGRPRGYCERGPVRVRLTVEAGRVASVHTYVGPVSSSAEGVRSLGVVPVRDAVQFLTNLARSEDDRAARDALLPIVLADSTTPWQLLLDLARSRERSRSSRRQASFWLARGAAAKLGLIDDDANDDDEVRRSAVFAISQQPRETSVPALLDIARSDRIRPAARAQALFWLGQSDDARALDYLATLLQ